MTWGKIKIGAAIAAIAAALSLAYSVYSTDVPTAHPSNNPSLANPNPSPANPNNQYSIYVYYTDSRVADSIAVVSGLAAAGFQTHRLPAKLTDTKLNQTAGSTFIIPTGKSKQIGAYVLGIVRQNLPNDHKDAVTFGGPNEDLKDGDVQVQLY